MATLSVRYILLGAHELVEFKAWPCNTEQRALDNLTECEGPSFPISVRVRATHYFEVTIYFYEPPSSVQEIEVALSDMQCQSGDGDAFSINLRFTGMYTMPEVMEIWCRSESAPHIAVWFGYLNPGLFHTLFYKFGLWDEGKTLGIEPTDNASDFRIAMLSGQRFRDTSYDPPVWGAVIYVEVWFPDDMILRYEKYLVPCGSGNYSELLTRDCAAGYPWLSVEEDAAGGDGCHANFSEARREFTWGRIKAILDDPRFTIDYGYETVNALLQSICDGFGFSLEREVLYVEQYSAYNNAAVRTWETIVSDMVDTVLKECPFEYTCTTHEFSGIYLLIAVSFPILSAAYKVLNLGLPMFYAFAASIHPHAAPAEPAAAPSESDMVKQPVAAGIDKDVLNQLVAAEVDKAMARFKDGALRELKVQLQLDESCGEDALGYGHTALPRSPSVLITTGSPMDDDDAAHRGAAASADDSNRLGNLQEPMGEARGDVERLSSELQSMRRQITSLRQDVSTTMRRLDAVGSAFAVATESLEAEEQEKPVRKTGSGEKAAASADARDAELKLKLGGSRTEGRAATRRVSRTPKGLHTLVAGARSDVDAPHRCEPHDAAEQAPRSVHSNVRRFYPV